MAILNPTKALRELYSLVRYGSYTFSQPDYIPAKDLGENAYITGISNERGDGEQMFLHVSRGKERAFTFRLGLNEDTLSRIPVEKLVERVDRYCVCALEREMNLADIVKSVEDAGGTILIPGHPYVTVFDQSVPEMVSFRADSVVKDEKTGLFYVQGRDIQGNVRSTQLNFLRDDEVLSVGMGARLALGKDKPDKAKQLVTLPEPIPSGKSSKGVEFRDFSPAAKPVAKEKPASKKAPKRIPIRL